MDDDEYVSRIVATSSNPTMSSATLAQNYGQGSKFHCVYTGLHLSNQKKQSNLQNDFPALWSFL